MATYSNITVKRHNPVKVVDIPVASATVIAPGDLIDVSGSTGMAFVHAGDNSTFVGVALNGSESGEIRPISVARECVVEALLVSGSSDVVVGDAVKRSAGANGTAWSFTKATAEGIMWANESISNGNRGEFYVDSSALAGGFAYDTCTEG